MASSLLPLKLTWLIAAQKSEGNLVLHHDDFDMWFRISYGSLI